VKVRVVTAAGINAEVKLAVMLAVTATPTALVTGTWPVTWTWRTVPLAPRKAVTGSALCPVGKSSCAAWAAPALKKSNASATHASSATRAIMPRRAAGRCRARRKPKSFSSARTNV
jgi:hypothetical protein